MDDSISFYFKLTINGSIEKVEDVTYLVCSDSTKLIVKSQSNPPASKGLWSVIPSTDSTGVISTVSLLDEESGDSEIGETLGRVVQLGKRHLQLKIPRPGEKTLKVNLLSPDPRMKIGQLWQIMFTRDGNTLKVKTANPIEDSQVPATTNQAPTKSVTTNQAPAKSVTTNQVPAKSVKEREVPSNNSTNPPQNVVTTVLPNISLPTKEALFALQQETGIDGWKLLAPKRRLKGWEWEAVSDTRHRARVTVKHFNLQTSVYQYPLHTENQSHELPNNTPINNDETERLIVKPLGAARGIGASCFQVFIGPYEVVLDCGTRPKGYDPLPALEHLKNPDLLLITHAHQDHLGAVPVFHSRYPAVPMICTPGTREIAHVMLTDCLKVQQRNEDANELFNENELQRTLFRLETKPIGSYFEPLPGLKVQFINAGHIVGAACIYLQYRERSLLYTGDYNTTSSRTTEGLKLADLPQADILITESTYGADTHPARRNQETALMNAIASVVEAGGNVLLPSFALGRAQEILLAIRTSALFKKLKIPIYVDGLVRAITDTFRDNLELLPSSVQNFAKQEEPFFNENPNPPIIPIGSHKERPLAIAHPSVIVASSGMLTGGPSVYYAGVLLERENAAIFISGYTDEESPGRMLQSLKTGDTVELDGKEITVKARIERFNLSAHADKIGLTQVINKVNPKHLILVHGSGQALHELAKSGDLRSKHYIHIPCVGEEVEYGQAPNHLSATQITKIEQPQEFEVQIEAEVEGAWLRIPEDIVETDPRWQIFAASGTVLAKWDGIALRLIPLTQQSLVRQKAVQQAIASGQDCCAVCQFFGQGNCQCEDSALFNLQVDPAGVCTEFSSTQSQSNHAS